MNMNRAILRWLGIGLFVCALAAIAAGLWISAHTLSTTPFDGTFIGVAASLGIWSFAALELSAHLRIRARLPGNNTRLRFDIHYFGMDHAPLKVPLAVATFQSLFLVVIAALTFEGSLFGMISIDQPQLAAELLLAQAITNFACLILGSFIFNVRREA
jgi:hypothetical protein